MSKINKLRFINLNYNNNTMKIDDETFYLDGENTMLNLRNGGGKSVLVQMVMAPFVNRRHRTLKDRTFDSYFTSSTPTFIMVEWKLDDGAGYLLTGMMVRKKESTSDENSKEKLDIINFIHEYNSKNSYDIDSIPVIEEKIDSKIIKSFTNTKKIFEDLKKNREFKFNYYDMNNSVTTRSYFSKLEEYKINYKEWETIIKQINLKESGLSELFIKAKDTAGLVKEWFLPAIENKLKKDEDRIKNYRNLLESYIKQYRANKSNIDKKGKIEFFNELATELIEASDTFILTIDEREDLENKIANIIQLLNKMHNSKVDEEVQLNNLIEALNKEIDELLYEKESIIIYKKKDELKSLEDELNEYKSLVSESKLNKDNLKRKNNILECARIHRAYQESSKEVQELETQLKILNEKNKDNAPKINNLGFTIKEILNKELAEITENINIKNEDKVRLNATKGDNENKLIDNRKNIISSKGKEGSLKTQIEGFDKVELNFNKRFKEDISRNIDRYYDEEQLIEFEKKLINDGIDLEKDKRQVGEKLLKSNDELKSKESEKVKNIEIRAEVKNRLENNEKELRSLEEEIENRIEVIKYIDFNKDMIFKTDEIIATFDKKIGIFRDEELNIIRQCDKVQKELDKLKGGKVLELSKEVEEKLNSRDISIKYGMEWLKHNGFSYDKNVEIINNNPFIPYSLIMNESDIESLEKEPIDVFTSNPISIINRTDLEKSISNINKDIVSFTGIKFFVSFNNKILNEDELIKLIESKEKELLGFNNILKQKREGIELYEKKRGIIIHSSLDEKYYDSLKERIIELKSTIEELRVREITLEKVISNVKEEIIETEKRLRELDRLIDNNKEKEESFKVLVDEYKSYKKNKEDLAVITERIKLLEKSIIDGESNVKRLIREIEEVTNIIGQYMQLENQLSSKIVEFNIFTKGDIIKKDKEDLLAEYEALTKGISESESDLKSKIAKGTEIFNRFERELNDKADRYGILESEYIKEIYNYQREIEFKDLLENEENNYIKLKEMENSINISKATVETKIENLYEKLKKEFNKNEPKSKELLFDKKFNEEIAKLRVEIKDKEKYKRSVKEDCQKIKQNLVNLSEFDNLVIVSNDDIDIQIEDLDVTIGKVKRDLTHKKSNEQECKNNLNNLMIEIEVKEQFKEETLFKEPIIRLKLLTAKPVEFKNHLNLVMDSYKLLMDKLLADIELIEKEENKILDSILEYIEEVHINIEKIDDNSSITIKGKRVKMLNINVTNFDENKELYKLKLRDYIELIRNRGIRELENNNDIEDIVSNMINIFKLYDEVVGIGSVNIKLYKIEEDRQRVITWDEVSKNSGGEGFLSAFVILSSLLSYMRKDENDIFDRKEGGKVIIMDNPFAQTSSSHLLKPLMDIAKKSNTQLICLTGLGGDSIYNRFDNIYVLNLISSKLKSGIKYLRSEHIKGEEEKEIIVASRFKIEEQTRLF